jgi:hypothetical protein
MRKDWIMSEEDKQLKKIKIEQNRARRQDGKREADDSKNMPARKVCLLLLKQKCTRLLFTAQDGFPLSMVILLLNYFCIQYFSCNHDNILVI